MEISIPEQSQLPAQLGLIEDLGRGGLEDVKVFPGSAAQPRLSWERC